jgi:hypothetical protein
MPGVEYEPMIRVLQQMNTFHALYRQLHSGRNKLLCFFPRFLDSILITRIERKVIVKIQIV